MNKSTTPKITGETRKEATRRQERFNRAKGFWRLVDDETIVAEASDQRAEVAFEKLREA